jgi:hypothetical protein
MRGAARETKTKTDRGEARELERPAAQPLRPLLRVMSNLVSAAPHVLRDLLDGGLSNHLGNHPSRLRRIRRPHWHKAPPHPTKESRSFAPQPLAAPRIWPLAAADFSTVDPKLEFKALDHPNRRNLNVGKSLQPFLRGSGMTYQGARTKQSPRHFNAQIPQNDIAHTTPHQNFSRFSRFSPK